MRPGIGIILFFSIFVLVVSATCAQENRILRLPSISEPNNAFTYGSEIGISNLKGENIKRNTNAIKRKPIISKGIVFTSRRSGVNAVIAISLSGGTPEDLTWHLMGSLVQGCTPRSEQFLYASLRYYS